MNWQPIDGAPKDGTLFLGCKADHYHPQEAVWAAYHPNSRGKECWRTSAICGNKIEGLTHWMPLPPPPSVEDGE